MTTRLYLLTPPQIEIAHFAEGLKRALGGGDVAAVQLRLKDVTDDEILRTAEILRPIIQTANAAFILNDRPDLAKRCGADGVHIGQQDTPYRDARAMLGPTAMIGVTAHASRHLAMEAADAGADYVAFGAMYPTTTKDAQTRATPDLITWWTDIMEVPCVAIGGITVENAAPIIAAGADFIAVSAGIWTYVNGPAAALKDFNRMCGR